MTRILLFAALLLAAGPARAEKTISSDTTWKASDSPVAVAEDTTVAAGVTLTIEPGVTVELAKGKSLTIKGTLVARGTSAMGITFTGKLDSGARVRWGSLVFADSSTDAVFKELDEYVSGSILERCTFSHATKAIKITASSPHVTACTFQDNECTSTKKGGAALEITGGAAPRVVGNTFNNNVAKGSAEGGAVYVDSSAPIIQDNFFMNSASVYGGALTTYHMYSPVVGNTFTDNKATFKGGAMALVSSCPAVLNNTIQKNSSSMNGGGVHVCIDCNPHATPFFMDNTITGNTNTLHTGAAGFGAAFIRVFKYNNIHGNQRVGQGANDFGWLHELKEAAPDWTRNVNVAHNWWGTTDEKKIAEMITDGNDNKAYGKVTFTPVLKAAVKQPETRVTITTRRVAFKTKDDVMPVYLTIYNPGAARQVDLVLMLGYGEAPPVPYRGKLDFPGATQQGRAFRLSLPKNGAYFTRVLQKKYPGAGKLTHGFWHAAIFDSANSKRIGDVSTIRFDLSK